jgi:hypothetical protein
MQVIEQTPSLALAVKIVIHADAEAEAGDATEAKDAGEAETTMSDIDRLVSDMVADMTTKTNVVAEESWPQCQMKEKKLIILLRMRGILIFGTWAVRNCPRKTSWS